MSLVQTKIDGGESSDSLTQYAAEILRVAVPLMSEHGIPVNPENYEVWYEYASRKNQSLRGFINKILRDKAAFTVDINKAIYDKFFIKQGIHSVSAKEAFDVQNLIQQLVQSLTGNCTQAKNYISMLSNSTCQLEQKLPEKRVVNIIKRIIDETDNTISSNKKLEDELEKTTSDLETLRKALDESKIEATTDELTQLQNRKGLHKAFDRLSAEAIETKQALSMMIIDLDFFKKLNDTHGHVVGDKLLKFIAGILRKNTRDEDGTFRYGGEEFVVLLPYTDIKGAIVSAENLRRIIESQRLKRTDTEKRIGQVTASFGVTGYIEGESLDAFVARADLALYESKDKGRNRVSVKQA